MSSSYRRKLRKPIGLVYVIPTVLPIVAPPCESQILIIQNKFYKILDDIILYNDFTSNISELHSILEHTRTIVDYYKLMDTIQQFMLSIVCNISNNVAYSIIQSRIDYIKTYITTLPDNCIQLSPLSDMILRLLDHIINTMDFSGITSHINEIHTYINEKHDILDVDDIHSTILSIICNIGQNTSMRIISERIQYLRQLVDQIPSRH